MKKSLLAVSGLVLAATIGATPINITQNLGYKTVGGQLISMAEDGNVDFGSNNYPEFDLKAFYYDKATSELSMVSGFNVFSSHQDKVTLGDIFIDIKGTSSEWDYAVVFNRGEKTFNDNSYAIINISDGFTDIGLLDRYDGQPVTDRDRNDHSQALPFAVNLNDIEFNKSFTYDTLSSGTIELNGAVRENSVYNMSGIDLSSIIGANDVFSVHLTQSCGNDIMTGNVPEPAILSLLGIGFFGLAFHRRRK